MHFIADTYAQFGPFAFIICIVLINRYFRFQREKMWHETARVAIEKGQPLPPSPRSCGWGWGSWWELQKGLILLAVGIGMYFAMPVNSRAWGLIPGLVGVAYLIFALFSSRRGGNGPSDPKSGDRLP